MRKTIISYLDLTLSVSLTVVDLGARIMGEGGRGALRLDYCVQTGVQNGVPSPTPFFSNDGHQEPRLVFQLSWKGFSSIVSFCFSEVLEQSVLL